MNAEEVVENLAKLGLQAKLVQTGHPDYIRCFVQLPQADGIPVALGRITIYQGAYSHIKWYVSNYGPIHTEWDYFKFAWNILINCEKVIDRPMWEAVVKRAYEMVEAEFQRKKQWREDNPKPNGKHRARLTTRDNPLRYVGRAYTQLLMEV